MIYFAKMRLCRAGGSGLLVRAVSLAALSAVCSSSFAAEAGSGAGNAADAIRGTGAASGGQLASAGQHAGGTSSNKWWPWDWFRQQREERERRERADRERREREERERREREERERRQAAELPLVNVKTKCGIAARQDRVAYYGGDITCAEKVGGCDRSKGEDAFNQGFANRRVSGTDDQQYQQCADFCCQHHMCYYFSIHRQICWIKKVRELNSCGSIDACISRAFLFS